MLKFLKKTILKIFLYALIISLSVFKKLYKIILDFFIKNKLKFKKFYNLLSTATVGIKEINMQINLKKELKKCLINLK